MIFRRAAYWAIFLFALSCSPLAAQGHDVTIHVTVNGEALENILVLILSDAPQTHTQAYLSNHDGIVHATNVSCNLCIVTAWDPKRLFVTHTTEFSSTDALVTLNLRLRPIIDRIFTPGAVHTKLKLRTTDGKPLSSAGIAVHLKEMTPQDTETARFLATNAKGEISIDLLPGTYVAATLIGGAPCEVSFTVKPDQDRAHFNLLLTPVKKTSSNIPDKTRSYRQ